MSTPKKRGKPCFDSLNKPHTPVTLKRKMSSSEMLEVRGRDVEILAIREFIRKCAAKQSAGVMFISGKPGTGKTACVQLVYKQHQGEKLMRNCMSLPDSGKGLYRDLLHQLNGLRSDKVDTPSKSLRSTPTTPSTPSSRPARSCSTLEQTLVDRDEPMKLIILDEIDQISDPEVLRQVFSWASLNNSRIILIGISNRLDLANSLGDSSTAKIKSALHFAPYTVDQIKTILQDRIENGEDDGSVLLDKVAVELCARKIAASTGDIRAALLFCRSGILTAEKQKRSKLGSLSNIAEDGVAELPKTLEKLDVKVTHINSVFQDVAAAKSTTKLSLQQRIMICCGLILQRDGKKMTLGALTDKFRRITTVNHNLSDADIIAVFDILVANGILCMKHRSKNVRVNEVYFGISEQKAETELAGKPLMDSLLAAA